MTEAGAERAGSGTGNRGPGWARAAVRWRAERIEKRCLEGGD